MRAATGYSVAPPYLGLLTNTAAAAGDYFPTTYFAQQGNAGDIQPETAFGWDLGADARFTRVNTVSVDLYETLLRNQFLTTTYLAPQPVVLGPNNAYQVPAGSYPLYVYQTQNLGHSRYAGIEVALHRDPEAGIGFTLQDRYSARTPMIFHPAFTIRRSDPIRPT